VLATTKLQELAQGCSPEHLDARERVKSNRAVVATLRNWCEGLQLSADALDARLAELTEIDDSLSREDAWIERMARHPYVGRKTEMEEGLSSADNAERTEQFTIYLQRAASFEDVMALLSINRDYANERHGQPLWRLGSELQVERYPQSDLLVAQNTAIFLFGCRRFGGCDSGQYLTIVSCLNNLFGRCAQGTSLFEQIYQTTPPATYDLARQILARI
jgi:hypothetical protein